MGARAYPKCSGMCTGRLCRIVQKMLLEARWDAGECGYVSLRYFRQRVHEIWAHEHTRSAWACVLVDYAESFKRWC